MKYIIHYDIAAIIILVITIAIFLIKRRIPSVKNRLFLLLAVVTLCSAVFDLTSVLMKTNNITSLIIINILNLISFATIPFVFMLYLIFVCDAFKRLNLFSKSMAITPYIINVLLISTNQFTKWFFYFDQNMVYHRGNMQFISYLIAFYHLIFALVIVFKSHKLVSKPVRSSVLFFTIMCLATSIVQFMFQYFLIESFVSSICLLIIMYTFQNEHNMLHFETKMLNRSKFLYDSAIKIKDNKKFSVLIIKILDYGVIGKKFGNAFSSVLIGDFAKYLYSFINFGDAYYIEDECIALFFDKEKKDRVERVYKEIEERLAKGWKIGSATTSISIYGLHIKVPSDTTNSNEFFDIVKHFKKTETNIGKMLVVNDLNHNDLSRIIEVEEALDYAIKNKTFEVHYQPIYSSDRGAVISCEALLRLTDRKLGPLYPDEFIPISEQTGRIVPIGLIVLEEACKFIKDPEIQVMGIEYVEVNLSAIQCIQIDLVEHIMEIVEKYKVEPRQICFEITETAYGGTPYIMENNIKALHGIGFMLALDDYGHGFSSMNNLLKFPFSFIKLDKSMVWSSFKDDKARIAVESTVAMVKKLNMKIIAEGVETVEQAERLVDTECDFLQGYYFSKPVRKEQLLEKLNTIQGVAI